MASLRMNTTDARVARGDAQIARLYKNHNPYECVKSRYMRVSIITYDHKST